MDRTKINSRTDWVDYAKALGIILVVYGHVARGLFNAGIEIPEHLYRLVDSIIYSFHMPLFFFLSGLFFYQSFSRRGSIGLTLNKVDTIIYPYLIWSILQGTVEYLLSSYTNGNVELTTVFSLWEPRAQFWFLLALFFVFVASIMIFRFLSEKHALLVFGLSCILYLNRMYLPDIKIISFISNNLVYFSLGIVFTKHHLSETLSSNKALLLTMAIFLLSQYFFHSHLGKFYTDKGYESLLLAFISIAFFVSLSVAIAKKKNNILQYIGASSMAIYLMHILAGSGIRVILSKFLSVESVSVHIVVGCIAGILLPLLALKVINALKISFAFSAPISQWLGLMFNKVFKPTSRGI